MIYLRSTNYSVTFRRGWQLITFSTSDYYIRMSVLKNRRFPYDKFYN